MSVRSSHLRGVVSMALWAGLSGCPSSSMFDVPEAPDAAADARTTPARDSSACTPVLGTRPESHACQHAEFGPFIEVTGSPKGITPADISHSQRSFVVDTEVGSAVSYRPSRDGLHAILFGPATGVVVTDGTDRELPLDDILTRECEMFAGAKGVELVAGARYTFTFSSDGGDTITGFVEHPASFGEDAWERACP